MAYGIGMGVTLLVLVLVGINVAVMRIGAKTGNARIAAHAPEHRIRLKAPMANYFGRQSQGFGQVRGNGALVLTDTELWFSRLLPRFDLTIPLGDITGIELVRSHLGKRAPGRLLKVTYCRDGAEDAAAWWVPHPNKWEADLRHEIASRTLIHDTEDITEER